MTRVTFEQAVQTPGRDPRCSECHRVVGKWHKIDCALRSEGSGGGVGEVRGVTDAEIDQLLAVQIKGDWPMKVCDRCCGRGDVLIHTSVGRDYCDDCGGVGEIPDNTEADRQMRSMMREALQRIGMVKAEGEG